MRGVRDLRHCCNCKKESLIYPYICPDCLEKLKKSEIENNMLREFLNKAVKLLKDKGFTEESKSISYMAEQSDFD